MKGNDENSDEESNNSKDNIKDNKIYKHNKNTINKEKNIEIKLENEKIDEIVLISFDKLF